MGRFQAKYSDQQREAIQYAYVDRHIRPVTRICELAAAGELELNGDLVPAFDITDSSARAIGERYARRREADRNRGVNGAETFRAELSGVIADELSFVRRMQARGASRKPLNPATITGLARAIRELQALESPESKPAQKLRGDNGKRSDGSPGGAMADKVRAAMAPSGYGSPPAPDDPLTTATVEVDDHSGAGAGRDAETKNGGDGGTPGDYARARIDGLRARAVTVRPAP